MHALFQTQLAFPAVLFETLKGSIGKTFAVLETVLFASLEVVLAFKGNSWAVELLKCRRLVGAPDVGAEGKDFKGFIRADGRFSVREGFDVGLRRWNSEPTFLEASDKNVVLLAVGVFRCQMLTKWQLCQAGAAQGVFVLLLLHKSKITGFTDSGSKWLPDGGGGGGLPRFLTLC